MRIEVDLSELEELILESLVKRSRNAEQIRYYLEGKGKDITSHKIAHTLQGMERMNLVTRVKMAKTYRYALNVELDLTDDD